MSKAKLQAAKELIDEQEYGAARAILETLTDNVTAMKWLARLNETVPPLQRKWEFCEIIPKIDLDEKTVGALQLIFGQEAVLLFTVALSDWGESEITPHNLKSVLMIAVGRMGKLGWEIISSNVTGVGTFEITTYLMKRPLSPPQPK